jgi:hypothetical protein
MNRIGIAVLVAIIGELSTLSATAHAESCVAYAAAELSVRYPGAFGPGAVVQRPESVRTIEQRERKRIAACTDCPQKPFGYMHADCQRFKSQLRKGDCIVFFHSDRASWKGLAGVKGYALIRRKTLVLEMLTGQS